MFKALWNNLRTGEPHFMRAINGWSTIFWIVMVPVSYFMGWLDSVVYVSALSLWALVSGHLSAWQASRVEVRQDEDNDVNDVMVYLKELDKRLCKAGILEPTPESREIVAELEEDIEENEEEEQKAKEVLDKDADNK